MNPATKLKTQGESNFLFYMKLINFLFIQK